MPAHSELEESPLAAEQQVVGRTDNRVTIFERAESAFSVLRDEYRLRKGLAERAVNEWQWATSSWFDVRPLYFERNGWPRGRRLRKVPPDPNGRIECGLDRLGRVVVERQHNEFGFYETFYNWATDPLEVAHFDYSPEKAPINLLVVHMDGDGRAVTSNVAAIRGHTQEAYRWDGSLVREVNVAHGERANGHLAPLLPLHKARARYDERGVVQRVELLWPPSPPTRIEDTVELMFERRGARLFRPRP